MLPSEFIERIKIQFLNEWEDIIEALDKEAATSIRYNLRKYHPEILSPIPWANSGTYLEARPSFVSDPQFHAGAYYVQESSSMFIDFVLQKLKSDISIDKVLDMSAAPGGKSTIVLDNLESHQYLVSNELIPQRNLVLRENLTKWGFPNFLISENKPKDFENIADFFDIILLDAPCSGEGMFRKDRNARHEWSPEIATMCSQRQDAIFRSIWNSLKQGGYLIYSTCTFNPEENEILLQQLLDSGFEFQCIHLAIPKEWNIRELKNRGIIGYQFLPHMQKGEGFYCSILKKKGDWKQTLASPSNSYINPWAEQFIDFKRLENYSSYKFKNSLFLAPNLLLDDLEYLRNYLYIKQIGMEIGQYQGNQLNIVHGMAMIAYPTKYDVILELDKEQALNYLSKKPLHLSLSDGIYLLKYQQIPLGWLEIKNQKEMNHYPNGWKIRKEI